MKLFFVVFIGFFPPFGKEAIKDRETNVDFGPLMLRFSNRLFLRDFFKEDTIMYQKCWQRIQSDSSFKTLVLINIGKQELTVLKFIDTFKIVLNTKVSTGRGSKWTPRGEFKILKKRIYRPSIKYGGTMTFWNCLTSDERIGIHGLKDRSYESNLGKPKSHGCIRISNSVAPIFYTLCPVGTPVFIE